MEKPVAQQAARILQKLLNLTREMAEVELGEITVPDDESGFEEQTTGAMDAIPDFIRRRQALLDELEQLRQSEGDAQALHSPEADALIAQILALDAQVNQTLHRHQQQVIEQIGRVVTERKQLQRQKKAVIFEPGTLLDIKK